MKEQKLVFESRIARSSRSDVDEALCSGGMKVGPDSASSRCAGKLGGVSLNESRLRHQEPLGSNYPHHWTLGSISGIAYQTANELDVRCTWMKATYV